MVRLEPIWRELYRTDDLDDALTVITTIAAMEFEARWLSQPPAAPPPSVPRRSFAGREDEVDDARSRDREVAADDDDHSIGDPPYIIEVAADDWAALIEVLDAIREEQQEFDAECAEGLSAQQRLLVALGASLAAAPVAVELAVLLRAAR